MLSDSSAQPDVAGCIPLVRSLAFGLRHSVPSHIHVDDLIGAGLVGLLEAWQRYRPDRGASLVTFAYPRVLGAMRDHVRQECRHHRLLATHAAECTSPRHRSPEGEAAANEKLWLLQKALGNLSARRRLLVEGLLAGDDMRTVTERLALTSANGHKLKRLAVEQLRAALTA